MSRYTMSHIRYTMSHLSITTQYPQAGEQTISAGKRRDLYLGSLHSLSVSDNEPDQHSTFNHHHHHTLISQYCSSHQRLSPRKLSQA